MSILEQLDERWGEDRGIAGVWSNYRDDGPWWEITRQFHPLTWQFGLLVQRELACSSYGNWLAIVIAFGPFSLAARREWLR